LENIKKISFDWELLAKKHEVEKISLGDLARSWEDDLAAMSSIVSTLPAAINLEKSALDTYLELSAKLSSLRREAVVDLESYLSEILPQLNMQEGGVALNISYRKSPSLYGSDEITMLSTGSPVESVFSSGELARLSLAMEGSLLLRDRDIVSSFSDDDAGNEVEDEECLFVFDEIDAHIGGEASNVAARLLKRIGKSKQVIAITRKQHVIIYKCIVRHEFSSIILSFDS
jgi:DNA repair ATPase RecN